MRLELNSEAEPEGYAADALDRWAARAKAWSAGKAHDAMPTVGKAADKRRRDVFVFFIGGDKVRAPAAATAFLGRL